MTEQNQTPGSTPPPAGRGDWREQRRLERDARWEERAERWRHRSNRSGLVWGSVLILLGVIFFLQNSGIALTFNWWAIFIFIPAFWSFVRAWDGYREENRLNRRTAGALVGGTLLTVVALVFLFNLSFSWLWPLLLILGGAALIMTGLIPA